MHAGIPPPPGTRQTPLIRHPPGTRQTPSPIRHHQLPGSDTPPDQTPPRDQVDLPRSDTTTTPPGTRQTPPDQTHPPWDQADPPWSDTTPRIRHHPPDQTSPQEADFSIRSTSGRYASYWNAFLFTRTVTSSPILTSKFIFGYVTKEKWLQGQNEIAFKGGNKVN